MSDQPPPDLQPAPYGVPRARLIAYQKRIAVALQLIAWGGAILLAVARPLSVTDGLLDAVVVAGLWWHVVALASYRVYPHDPLAMLRALTT